MKRKLNFNLVFWIFIFGSIGGVFVEMFWCMLKNGYIASRHGVIYGPFNPLYGFGAVMLTYLLLPISDKKDRFIFFGSFVIGSIIEYIFHIGQAELFGTYSWDYSAKFMNLNGRIDLLHSILWGILGIFWLRKIFPWIEKNVTKLKILQNNILIICLAIFMILNICISGMAVSRWSARSHGIEASNIFEVTLDKLYPDAFLEVIYPNMKVIEKK